MNCFVEAETTENYLRMLAMNQASESIKEMLGKKESEIRKFRQTLITKELVEIISGAEALKNRKN
jgi:F-type H+-transporting ATPase subunit gamma